MSYSARGACNDWETLHTYKNIGINDIAHDRFGNTYVVGGFWIDDLVIGPLHFPVEPSTQTGTFLIKFDKDFKVVWGVTPQISGDGRMREVDVDNDDNVVVAGDYFRADISFGCLTLNNSGRVDIFVVNYTQDGDPVWAISSTGTNDENIAELDVSANGDIVISATYVGDNNAISMGGKPIQPFGGYDSFVASIHPNGTMGWARGFGGTTDVMPDYIYGLVTDSQNNIIFTGITESPEIKFDQYSVHSFNISENYFLVKLGPDGVTKWAKEQEAHVYQWGFDCDVDANDNILVTGRFSGGSARFGSFTLPSQGSADVFVVKTDPSGNPLYARAFGGADYDVGSVVKIDHEGNIVLGSYYYSKSISLDGFSSSKTESHADVFVATLSPDLSVQCARFITGTSEAYLWDITFDAANNTWVVADNTLMDGETNFGNRFTVTDTNVGYYIAILGEATLTSVPPHGPPPAFAITLGPDVLKCPNDKITLSPGTRCGAQYTWSTGSHDPAIDVQTAGAYWVEMTWQGETRRATVTVTNFETITVDLGNDQTICAGNSVAWNLPAFTNATYLWNDGTRTPAHTANATGKVWVQISNRCGTVSDTVQVKLLPIPKADLGADQAICGNQMTLQYIPQDDVNVQWSDGSSATTLKITTSGSYSITATNACGTANDTVQIELLPTPKVDLAGDQNICDGRPVLLQYTPQDNTDFRWSDGSTSPTLEVVTSGTYALTATNACGTAYDEVNIRMANLSMAALPNVVTANGDHKNDYFELPDGLDHYRLKIYNRWGELVYETSAYQNDWPQREFSAGVYFYTLRGECASDLKGSVQLLH